MTEQQQLQIAGVLAAGCPLDTAADLAGVDCEAVQQTLASDAALDRRFRRARAGAELNHVQNVKNAASDSKNWRASVWWLEHCLPEKYGRRPPASVPAERYEAMLAEVLAAINEQVLDEDDRQRLQQRLRQLALDECLDQPGMSDHNEEEPHDVEA